MNMPVKVNKSCESEMKNKSTSSSEVNTIIPRLSSLSLSTSKTTLTETSADATSSSSTFTANSATCTHQPVVRVATLSTSSSSPTIIVANSNQQQIENQTKSEKNCCCSDGEDERGNDDDTNKKSNVDDCDDDDDEDADSLIIKKEKRVLGCAHYKRRAMFVTPCCNKFYKCRYCHDENEDHHFDRKTLTELICSECDTRQRVQEVCENCGVRFGKYTCLICNLFDDEDKAQYHCNGCGICRIGGRKNFFHCEVCNMCLPIQLKIEGHRCVENISRSNCPVCLGDIHTSRIPCHIPDCGHLLHKMCFDQLLASGHYVCPTCQTSIIDMTKMWEYLDEQALLMPVPKIYENRLLNIFCNDCHKTSTVKFHFIGLKCFYCGGYNTTQDVKRRRSWVMVNSKDNASTSA